MPDRERDRITKKDGRPGVRLAARQKPKRIRHAIKNKFSDDESENTENFVTSDGSDLETTKTRRENTRKNKKCSSSSKTHMPNNFFSVEDEERNNDKRKEDVSSHDLPDPLNTGRDDRSTPDMNINQIITISDDDNSNGVTIVPVEIDVSSHDSPDLLNTESDSNSEEVEIKDEIKSEVESSDSDVNNSSSDVEIKEESYSEENQETDEENQQENNAGWADSIAKILKTKKPKNKRTLVLSKAKKLTDVLQKEKPKEIGFQIDGEIKDEKPDVDLDKIKTENEEPAKKKLRKDITSVRIKPNILDKDRERTLSKIATKGVVQLFNAVRAQQKDIDNKLEEAGPLERKRENAMKSIDKRAFLDVLMQKKSEKVDGDVKEETKKTKKEKDSTWNVLRDDFMMGAKMKDWDKEVEEDSDQEVEEESDSD